MPSLIQLLAALLLKNTRMDSFATFESLWPSLIRFNVAVGLARRRVMKALHPDHLPAGLVGGEKALAQEPSGGTERLKQPPRVFLKHTGVRF